MSFDAGRFPTIPEYYRELIDPSVDLLSSPKQFCPFHHNVETPSFSYSHDRNCWSCFGACKAIGKDVIDMHQRNYKLKDRVEAEESLRKICRYPKKKNHSLQSPRIMINEDELEQKQLIQSAIILANCPERWLALDLVMSKFPLDTNEIYCLVQEWKKC